MLSTQDGVVIFLKFLFRWCLIHPNAPKTLVKPTREESGKHPDEAVNWFNTVYHRVIKLDWPEQFPVVHALQKPGDLMFVPSGKIFWS